MIIESRMKKRQLIASSFRTIIGYIQAAMAFVRSINKNEKRFEQAMFNNAAGTEQLL